MIAFDNTSAALFRGFSVSAAPADVKPAETNPAQRTAKNRLNEMAKVAVIQTIPYKTS